MDKFEQTVAVLTLTLGLLLMLEGVSHFSQSEPADSLAILLAGPDGIQKTAQAGFLQRRYGLRTISARELTREIQRGRHQRFLLQDCAPEPREQQCLSTLAGRKDLPPPVFIEIADRRLQRSTDPAWDVDLIQSYFPDAGVWTLDGTRQPNAISETLRRLLDRPSAQ